MKTILVTIATSLTWAKHYEMEESAMATIELDDSTIQKSQRMRMVMKLHGIPITTGKSDEGGIYPSNLRKRFFTQTMDLQKL